MVEGPLEAPLILVVDDDFQVLKLMRHFLSAAGYEVHVAPSAKAATTFLREADVQVVIVDLFMPGEDGLEIIQALRGNGRRPKIMAMSGHAEPFLRIAAQLGADAVLSKPFTQEELLLKIRKLLMPD